jgi:hypothetical protein
LQNFHPVFELLETVVLLTGFDNPVGDVHQMDCWVRWTGKSFDAARSNEAADESAVRDFACRIMLNMTGSEKMSMKRDSGARASGCPQSPTKNPHEMGSKKGNVKG